MKIGVVPQQQHNLILYKWDLPLYSSHKIHLKNSPVHNSSMEVVIKESGNTRFKVLMLPYLAHGHISAYLELAKQLNKRNFQVYLCSTEVNLDFIKKNKLHCDENSSDDHHHDSIELVQLHLPELPELPPHYQTTRNLPPHLNATLAAAFQMAKPSFSNIVDKLKPDLIIYDTFQSWVPELASLNHIPCVYYAISSATNHCFFTHVTKFQSFQGFPFSAIYFRDHERKKLLASLGPATCNEELLEKDFDSKAYAGSCEIVLIRGWKEVDRKYLDHLSFMRGKKMVPLGPLIDQNAAKKVGDEKNHADLIKFLNNKDKSSVVYIAFGSEGFLSKEEREEIARGLELISNVNFIWVIRFPVGNTISLEEALPDGFLERVKERGMIMDWAPQHKILEHSSVGGFLCHCGWNSAIESLYYGVPLIAIPMICPDQRLNARYLVELGAGIEIPRDENWQIKGEDIAEAIKMVVFEKSGEQMREKVKDMSKKLREKAEEDLNEAVEQLTNICIKKQTAEVKLV